MADLKQILQKTTGSIIFLTLRNFGIQGISVLGFFLLTLLLGPSEVGLFAIVAESVSILGYFSDLGLAAALIQQSRKPDDNELQAVFLIQNLLVLFSLVMVSLIFSRVYLAKSYGPKEFWIFVSLCFAYVAASLKTIPSVLLERNLNFRVISTVDIVENLTFYLLAVIFAFLGLGAYAYVIATFVRSLLGLTLIYYYQSWPLGFAWSPPAVSQLFRFGLPFQLNSLIAMAKDRLSNLLVAGIIGRQAFGLLSWAQKGPRLPLSFMDAVMKVTFPTFSRLQAQSAILSRSIQKTIFFIAFFIFPALAGIALIAPDIINLIPKYSRWSPALLPLYLYAASYAIAAVTTPLTNAFNAVGKITTTTRFMVLWTVLTWIFFPLFSFRYGYLGTAVASLIVGSSSFLVWFLASKTFSVNVFATILHPFFSTLLFTAAIVLLHPPLLVKIFLALFVYLSYHLVFSRPQINWFFRQLQCHFAKK